MGRLPCLFGVAALLFVRNLKALFAPVLLGRIVRWLLVDIAHRVSCALGAVLQLVPGLATVVAFPFEFGTSSAFLFPVTLTHPIDTT